MLPLLHRRDEHVPHHEKLAEDIARFAAEEQLLGQSRMYRERRVDAFQVRPAVEVLRGIDRAVVAEAQQLARVNLEMQVRRAGEGVTGVSEEADHLSRVHARRVEVAPRVSGEMRVVELVAGVVPHPQPPAADLLPAHAVDRSARDGDDRDAERREDVVAVVPAAVHVAAGVAVCVDVAGGADDGEDEVALPKRGRDLERLRNPPPMLLVAPS